MNKLLFLVLATAASASFAANDTGSYKQMTAKAASDYKAAKAACDSQSGNDKSICVAQAKANRAHAEADAAVQYKNDPKSLEKARVAAADADYDLAKAKCSSNSGTEKDNCLATAKRDKATAVADARSAAGKEGTMSGKASEAVADSVITTKVKADLIREPDLKSLDVHVETTNGVVMLSGFVPSQAEADKAINVARNVKGVTKVENGLQIQPPETKK